jgi:cob(I)alamin adenosyltransferase
MPSIYTRRGDEGTTDTFGGGRICKTDNLIATVGAIDTLNSTIGIAYEHVHGSLLRRQNFLVKMRSLYYSTLIFIATLTTLNIPHKYLLFWYIGIAFIICLFGAYIKRKTLLIENDYAISVLRELNIIMNLNFTLSSVVAELPSKNKMIIMPDFTTKLEQYIDQYDKNLPPLRNFILPRGNIAVASLHHCRTTTRVVERELWLLAKNSDFHIDDKLHKYLNRLSDYFFTVARHVIYEEKLPEVIVAQPTNDIAE